MQISIGPGSTPLYILGQVEFRVLEGEVSVNGRILSCSSPSWSPLFSPRSNALLAFESVNETSIIELRSLSQNGLESIQSCQTAFNNLFTPEADISHLFHEAVPGCFVLKPTDTQIMPLMRVSQEWKEVVSELLEGNERRPCVFVCGHRKIGKSTFSRFLLNSLLNVHPQVDLIDLDLGQTEFTTAGFVARKRFSSKDALLGPPFTHLSAPEDAIYLASSNGSESPHLYCGGLMTIKRLLSQDTAVPVVINTMGWMTGLGLEFIQFALQLFKPTHVTAFMAPEDTESDIDPIRKCLITKCSLMNQTKGVSPFTDDEASTVNIRYMGSPVIDGPRVKHTPSDLRNLAFWAYFFGSSNNEEGGVNTNNEITTNSTIKPSSWSISKFNFESPCLSVLKPVVVPLSAIQLACTSREINLFDLISEPRPKSDQLKLLESWMLLRLVGLSHDPTFDWRKRQRWVNLLSKTSRIVDMPCMGVGLIRSIVRVNPSTIHLHIITPLPLSLISGFNANTLVFGSQQVPHQLYAADSLSVQKESPGFSTQTILSSDVNGSGARKPRHNMRRN